MKQPYRYACSMTHADSSNQAHGMACKHRLLIIQAFRGRHQLLQQDRQECWRKQSSNPHTSTKQLPTAANYDPYSVRVRIVHWKTRRRDDSPRESALRARSPFAIPVACGTCASLEDNGPFTQGTLEHDFTAPRLAVTSSLTAK